MADLQILFSPDPWQIKVDPSEIVRVLWSPISAERPMVNPGPAGTWDVVWPWRDLGTCSQWSHVKGGSLLPIERPSSYGKLNPLGGCSEIWLGIYGASHASLLGHYRVVDIGDSDIWLKSMDE